MPLTFIDIERQKSWRIWAFFLILMLLYFVVTAVFTSIFLPVSVHTSAHFWIFAGVIAIFVAGIHFLFSAYDTV
ncbi:MAG TPA: hypothetical protein VLG72_00960, partial [Nitrospirota bacterium]|nr:hypothetical protein [Nitrospirota bacterium]